MPRVLYIEADGTEHSADAPEGWTVMEGAVKNNIPGIDADCGGACACATCHVYVEPEWLERLGPQSDMEQSMLDFAEDVEAEGEAAALARACGAGARVAAQAFPERQGTSDQQEGGGEDGEQADEAAGPAAGPGSHFPGLCTGGTG